MICPSNPSPPAAAPRCPFLEKRGILETGMAETEVAGCDGRDWEWTWSNSASREEEEVEVVAVVTVVAVAPGGFWKEGRG
jgi:hypothetical protein